MFALGIRYLNGWSMAASDGARKEQAEWPPHPDRVFMALAAAWFETGEDSKEGAALRWLEALPPPAIAASDATRRLAVVSYVPVNDDGHKKIAAKTDLAKLRKRGLALVPEHRSRQARGFPVAIPCDPTVHLIWQQAELGNYSSALARLATKVTHVGHSASFVQAWVEDGCDIPASWAPTEGVATHRLRVPSTGRLDQLARPYQAALRNHGDRLTEIETAEANLVAMTPPPRVAWRLGFPDAVLLAAETETKQHPQYAAAKSGDGAAAGELIGSLVSQSGIAAVRNLVEGRDSGSLAFVCAHAYEHQGVNAIPSVLSEWLSVRLHIPFIADVVQSNVVSYTGADGYGRLARQARFEGDVDAVREYVMVDDFIGQGGTLANMRGWIEKQGGTVIGAVGLTGKPYSAKLSLTKEQLHELRNKHGRDFEKWWRTHFGHAFNCLTQSEARYLARSPDVDTIRDRLAAAQREGDCPSDAGSVREQRQRIRTLKSHRPPTPMRPLPGLWQGYSRPRAARPETMPHSIFDPRIVVLGIGGRRVFLPATLRLTLALRGLLMRRCSDQPPPEWFSGHRADGGPSAEPHLALVPLPFVGSRYADGRIMGLGLVLPRQLGPQQVGGCLEPILRHADTGLPRDDLRLFDGEWFACGVELETRENPPASLLPGSWTASSRVWASVTPVVLNRHFDGDDKLVRAVESVQGACEHTGLPRPQHVLLHPVSLVEGVPHSREFPQLTRKRDGGRQRHTHAVITFEKPVVGPVLIGAGRFRGYGLCRPMDSSTSLTPID